MEEYKLFDAEYRLMELVWSLEPVNSTALARRCEAELGWKKSTVFNLIRKLAGRGFLKNEHATVTALVKKLAAGGYVTTAKQAEDKRVVLVKLTDRGRQLQPVFDSISNALTTVQCQGLDAEDLEAFDRTLRTMQENFETALKGEPA